MSLDVERLWGLLAYGLGATGWYPRNRVTSLQVYPPLGHNRACNEVILPFKCRIMYIYDISKNSS